MRNSIVEMQALSLRKKPTMIQRLMKTAIAIGLLLAIVEGNNEVSCYSMLLNTAYDFTEMFTDLCTHLSS